MQAHQDTTIDALLGTSITLSLAGQPLQVTEMTVRQTLQLLQHRQAIAALDFSDVPALLEQHQDLVITLMAIMLAIDKDRLLNAKNSELMAALQTAIALNKTFFLQAVQSVVAAMQIKAAVQTQISQAQQMQTLQPQPKPPTPPAGPAPSASSSPLATASAMSTPTPPVNSPPIPGLSTT
jgi:hypothetical protein